MPDTVRRYALHFYPCRAPTQSKMGFIFSKLLSRLRGTREYKIVLVGLANAGKTTMLYKLHLGQVVTTHPTIGSNVEELRHGNVRLQVWDLGGQESLRSSWATYFTSSHGVIYVVDSSDPENMTLAKVELFNLLLHPDLVTAPLLVLANKQDVVGGLNVGQVSEGLSLTAIRDHEWTVIGTSAITGAGLEEGLDWLTQKLSESKR